MFHQAARDVDLSAPIPCESCVSKDKAFWEQYRLKELWMARALAAEEKLRRLTNRNTAVKS